MFWNSTATHPSNGTRLWYWKYPHSTRIIFMENLKCVAQAHITGKLACPKASAKSNTSVIARGSFSPARWSEPSTLPKSPTWCARFLHARPWRPNQHGARNRSHQRIKVGRSAKGRSHVTFFGIKKNIRRACLLRPSPTPCHFLKEFHNVSSCSLRQF